MPMKGKGPDKPTTAILIGTNGSDVGHKAKARPWSEGPAKQFGLGPGPKRGGYADFDKKGKPWGQSAKARDKRSLIEA